VPVTVEEKFASRESTEGEDPTIDPRHLAIQVEQTPQARPQRLPFLRL